PAPFGPNTTSVSPVCSDSVTLPSASRSPYQRASPSIRKASPEVRTPAPARSVSALIAVSAAPSLMRCTYGRSGADCRGRVLALRLCDQLAYRPLVPRAQQLDRIGIAADDPLEELLAIPISRQLHLVPAAHLVEQHSQAVVLGADLLFDLPFHALGQRRQSSRCLDRDRQRPG